MGAKDQFAHFMATNLLSRVWLDYECFVQGAEHRERSDARDSDLFRARRLHKSLDEGQKNLLSYVIDISASHALAKALSVIDGTEDEEDLPAYVLKVEGADDEERLNDGTLLALYRSYHRGEAVHVPEKTPEQVASELAAEEIGPAFVRAVRKELVTEPLREYEEEFFGSGLFGGQAAEPIAPGSDPGQERIDAFLGALGENQRAALLDLLRRVMVDAVASLLAVFDSVRGTEAIPDGAEFYLHTGDHQLTLLELDLSDEFWRQEQEDEERVASALAFPTQA